MTAANPSRSNDQDQQHNTDEAAAQRRMSLFDEHVIRIGDVATLLPPRPDGRRVGTSTIYRWTLRGVRGVVLESARAPFGRITSVEAVERFIARLNHADPTAKPLRLMSRRRQRRVTEAQRYVSEALGITPQDNESGGAA